MSGAAGFDIRLPIGVLFLVLGALLALYGVMTLGDAGLYARSDSVNINLWWGLALLLFGGAMYLFGHRARTVQGMHPSETSPEGIATELREHALGLEREDRPGDTRP
jgi:hypothetical protein